MTSCRRQFTGLTLSPSGHGRLSPQATLRDENQNLKRRRESERQKQTQREWNEEWGEQRKENDLAVTQLDHYLLLHKCDVVEKVKLIVWKWEEGAGLILNHYHHCTMADSGSGLQGVLPWCSLEQIDKLVLRLQREECGMKRLKTHCPLCNCPLSAEARQENVCSVFSMLVWFIGAAV